MNVRPVLGGGSGKGTGLQLVVWVPSGSMPVFLATALSGRLRCMQEAQQYRMLVGRQARRGAAT